MCIYCNNLGEDHNWNSTDNIFTKKFIIPVGNMTEEEALNCMRKLMKDYKEDIQWDDSIDLKINPNINHDQDIWFPIKKDEK